MFPVLHPYQITRYSNAHQGMALSSGVLHPYQITRYSNPKLELKSTLCLFYYIHILLFASPLFSICCLLTEKSSKASDMPLGTPSGMLSEPIKIFITESQTWENDCYDQPLTGMLPDTAYFCSRQAAFLHCQIVFKSLRFPTDLPLLLWQLFSEFPKLHTPAGLLAVLQMHLCHFEVFPQ